MTEFKTRIIVGADTHKLTHTVAVLLETGTKLGAKEFLADRSGYEDAHKWVLSFGTPARAGIESTGSYGRGLSDYFKEVGIPVLDVYAPDKSQRRLKGKDDTLDAYQAAEAALAMTRCAQAKDVAKESEALLYLETAYKLAVKQRTGCINALRAAIIKCPDALRKELEAKTITDLLRTCASYRLTNKDVKSGQGIKLALKSYARQIKFLNEETSTLDKQIKGLVQVLLPKTVGLAGVGHHGAATLLQAAGSNIERIKNERAFAMLCGVSPIPVSSGNNTHYRLNRGGNRPANSAIHIMAITRIRYQEETRDYISKKMSQGKTKKGAIRSLKRYLAREVYGSLKADLTELGLVV
jgi:transposase